MKKLICTSDFNGWLLALQKDKLENSLKSQLPRCIGNEIQFKKKFNRYTTFENALLVKEAQQGPVAGGD